MSDGLLSARVNEEEKEVLNPKRFKDFYKLYLKDKAAMLSSFRKEERSDLSAAPLLG